MRGKKAKIKISNPFRFLTFLLVSLVATTTLVSQTVKLFADSGEEMLGIKKEPQAVDNGETKTDFIVSVPQEAKANIELYKTVKNEVSDIVSKEVDLNNIGALARETLRTTLKDVKWFKDEEKSAKQGLAVFLELENVTEEEITVGRYVGDLLKPSLSYGENTLKAHSQGMGDIETNAYGFTSLVSNFQNYKLVQTSEFPEVKTCDASITLDSGMKETCYLVYDYAGTGDYTLSFKTGEKTESFGTFTVSQTLSVEE